MNLLGRQADAAPSGKMSIADGCVSLFAMYKWSMSSRRLTWLPGIRPDSCNLLKSPILCRFISNKAAQDQDTASVHPDFVCVFVCARMFLCVCVLCSLSLSLSFFLAGLLLAPIRKTAGSDASGSCMGA